MIVVDEMVMVNLSEVVVVIVYEVIIVKSVVVLLVTQTVTVIGQDHVVSWLLLLESVVVMQAVPVLMV